MNGFWIKWPEGLGHTGVITDSLRLAQSYARQHGGEAMPEAELAAYEALNPFPNEED